MWEELECVIVENDRKVYVVIWYKFIILVCCLKFVRFEVVLDELIGNELVVLDVILKVWIGMMMVYYIWWL